MNAGAATEAKHTSHAAVFGFSARLELEVIPRIGNHVARNTSYAERVSLNGRREKQLQ